MADARDLDVVVFGATGFTGQFVMTELARRVAEGGDCANLRIGAAGRTQSKVEAGIAKATESHSVHVQAVVADVKDEESLANMAGSTRLVINCVGPFRFYGAPVVKACVDAGTHYVDICGEPEFIESAEADHFMEAQRKNITVVSAAGWDSVPADLGALFAEQAFRKAHPGGRCSAIESYVSVEAGKAGATINYATWEAAVHGIANAKKLKGVRRRLTEVNKARASSQDPPKVQPFGQRLKRRGQLFWTKELGKYAIPFMGSDASVVRRSQLSLLINPDEEGGAQPVQYGAYATISSIPYVIGAVLLGLLLGLLSGFKFGRSILIQHGEFLTCGIFSRKGPTQQQLNETATRFDFFAHGYTPNTIDAARSSDNPKKAPKPDATVHTLVHTPEPGYRATSAIVVSAAICVLLGKNIPRGVHTPATAFRHEPRMMAMLEERDINFRTL